MLQTNPTVSKKRKKLTPEKDANPTNKRVLSSDVMGRDDDFNFKGTESQLKDLIITTVSAVLETKLAKLASKEDISLINTRLKKLEDLYERQGEKIEKNEQTISVQGKIIEDLINRSKKNNLIFKGLEYSDKDDYITVVKTFCSQLLGIERDIFINRAHPLGPKTSKYRPIMVHLPLDKDISDILAKTKLLRGTQFFIQKDYEWNFRQRRNKLFVIRKEIIKLNENITAKVVSDRLMIGQDSFVWNEKKGLTTAKGEEAVNIVGEIINRDPTQILQTINRLLEERKEQNHATPTASYKKVNTP